MGQQMGGVTRPFRALIHLGQHRPDRCLEVCDECIHKFASAAGAIGIGLLLPKKQRRACLHGGIRLLIARSKRTPEINDDPDEDRRLHDHDRRMHQHPQKIGPAFRKDRAARKETENQMMQRHKPCRKDDRLPGAPARKDGQCGEKRHVHVDLPRVSVERRDEHGDKGDQRRRRNELGRHALRRSAPQHGQCRRRTENDHARHQGRRAPKKHCDTDAKRGKHPRQTDQNRSEGKLYRIL